jgi:glycosyltransferase involved in cell wall biosynthesis
MIIAGSKVLFLVPEDHYFVSHRLSFAKMLIEQGVEVHVLTKISTFGAEIANAGVKCSEWGYDRAALGVVAQLRAVMRLQEQISAVRPDLIHAVAMKPILYCGALKFVTRNFVPTVNAIAGLGSAFLARSGRRSVLARWGMLPGLRLALKHPNTITAVQNAGDLEQLRGLGVPAEALVLTGGVGVDVEQFAFSEEPQDGLPIVMFAARLLKDKGIFEFLEAARNLLRENVKARFVVVGAPDPDNPSSVTQQQVDAWAGEKLVEFWGRQKNMACVLPKASMVCLPSHAEGFPRTLVEAAACGRAVVASDVPGCRAVVEQGVTGILVAPAEIAPLAGAIKNLLEDVPKRKQMARAARNRAVTMFSVEMANARMFDVYRQLLQPQASVLAAQAAR